MDYIYTAFHAQSIDGTPVLSPLFFHYPSDPSTASVDLQFFYGPNILVSPVTEENSTSVDVYLPAGRFYDFTTGAAIDSEGGIVTLDDIDYTQIPLHIRGGAVLPLRANGTMTTTELRKTDFELLVAPDADGFANGTLYVDDGVSVSQNATTEVVFTFGNGVLNVNGTFGYELGVKVSRVVVLDVKSQPSGALVKGEKAKFAYDEAAKSVAVDVGLKFDKSFEVEIKA